jgi:Uma2 family endonuclease
MANGLSFDALPGWKGAFFMAAPPVVPETLAELVEQLGGIPLERILLRPYPGTATEKDVLEMERRENRLCELVDGVLVEKAMGFRESLLAIALAGFLRAFVRPRKLGVVAGADGTLRLAAGLVRIPDVSFVSWDRLPGRRVPSKPIPRLAPNLAVEVLSEGNTKKEMKRKVGEYFEAGVVLVWLVQPKDRTVTVYTAVDQFVVLDEKQTLEGGPVLPGFSLPLAELFAEMDLHGDD